MEFKRLIKKTALGGGNLVTGHFVDALLKQKKTGNSYKDSLKASFKETITEDLPGTSDIYKIGCRDGRTQGTIEQAMRDKEKMEQLQESHDQDRAKWKQTDKQKDEIIQTLIDREEQRNRNKPHR